MGSTLVSNRVSIRLPHVWIGVFVNVCVLVKVLANVSVGARVGRSRAVFFHTSNRFALAIAEYLRAIHTCDEPIAQRVPHFCLNNGF